MWACVYVCEAGGPYVQSASSGFLIAQLSWRILVSSLG